MPHCYGYVTSALHLPVRAALPGTLRRREGWQAWRFGKRDTLLLFSSGDLWTRSAAIAMAQLRVNRGWQA